MSAQYVPAQYDTAPHMRISVSLDVGIIPQGYPDAGQYVVTIQALPLPHRRAADEMALALKEAVESRLGIRFDAGTHVT